MSLKRTLMLTCFILLFLSLPIRAGAASKLSPELQHALLQNGSAEYLVQYVDEANLAGAATVTPLAARRQFVYDRLRQQALRSQAEAVILLQNAGTPFRAHYLLNALEVTSDTAMAQRLAGLPGVARLSAVGLVRNELPQPAPGQVGDGRRSSPADTIPWGLTRVRAPDVWNTYGTRGEGIVVGIADTGIQWDHPALEGHYRGWNGSAATHDYNWHDAIHADGSSSCGTDIAVPCDDYGHGTHVTGTLAGDDGNGNRIGVAPGAKWIGCRNMASGYGSIARYTECFEFMLAPYQYGGDPLADGRPALAADVINNSWSCVPPAQGEDCDLAHLNDMRSEVQKLNAAGIMVVAAAGNEGSGCGSVQYPIGIYPETFSAGATDSGDAIAAFSSRGPVTIDGSNRRKPDISAPGVSVYSSVPTNGYASMSGTSMASPHVSGLISLLWSAVPALRGDVPQTEALVQMSADHMLTTQGCGGDTTTSIPNNTFGYGIVNAFTAVSCAPIGLCLDKAVSTGAVHPGEVFSYTIHAGNVSGITATGVLVADHVPANITYAAGSIAGVGADDGAAPILRWHIGDLPPREISGTLALTFSAQLKPGSGGTIANTAEMSGGQQPPKVSNIAKALIQYLSFLPLIAR